MEIVQTYIDKLKEEGFTTIYYDYIDNNINSIDLYKDSKPDTPYIRIYCEYSAEYLEEIKSLPEGIEFNIDLSRCIVNGICFINNYLKDGFYVDSNKLPKYFDKAFRFFKNPTLYLEKTYLPICIANLKYLRTNIQPILEKYDYSEIYNSFFDLLEKDSEDLDLHIVYKHKYYPTSRLSFWVDILTGEFIWTYGQVNADTFEETLLKNEMETKDGKTFLPFEYYFTEDKTFTPTSYKDINKVQSSINCLRNPNSPFEFYDKKEINFKNIPKSYHSLVTEYFDLYKKNLIGNVIADFEAFKSLVPISKDPKTAIDQYLEQEAFLYLKPSTIKEILTKYLKITENEKLSN